MNVEIVEIKNRGIYEEERLVLKAMQDIDLVYYFVMHTKYTNEGKNINTNPIHTKWFPRKSLKANDLIILYTKKGTYSSIPHEDGSTSHFYYWDIPQAIYTNKDDCAVVLELKTWNTSKRV